MLQFCCFSWMIQREEQENVQLTMKGRMLTLVLHTEEWGKLSALDQAGNFSSRALKQDQWKMKMRIPVHRSWRTSSTAATDQAWVSQLKGQYWPFSLVSSGRPFQDDLRKKHERLSWVSQTQIILFELFYSTGQTVSCLRANCDNCI